MLLLKRVINNKKKLSFEEEIGEKKINPKAHWRTLKCLGMPFKRWRQRKISLKENVSFNSKDNTNTFCRFFSHSADSVFWKLPRQKNKFEMKTTELHYK